MMEKSKRFPSMEASHVYGEKENVGGSDWLAQEAMASKNTKLSSNL